MEGNLFLRMAARLLACLIALDLLQTTQAQWCFPRSKPESTETKPCVYSTKIFRTKNETDCCLWKNVQGYVKEPKWSWSIKLGTYDTPCIKCRRNKFVACFQYYHESGCSDPHDRLAENLNDCCDRLGIRGYMFLNQSECHRCPRLLDAPTNAMHINGQNPGWGPWSLFSPCSSSCGHGVQRRYRKCNSGNDCQGKEIDEQRCEMPPCPPALDGAALIDNHDHSLSHLVWGPWSNCHVTCGIGVRTRTKICPSPEGGVVTESSSANLCDDHTEVALCESDPCPPTSSSGTGHYDTGVQAAWAVAGVALIVTLVGLGAFYCGSRFREPVLRCLHIRRRPREPTWSSGNDVHRRQLPSLPPENKPPPPPKYFDTFLDTRTNSHLDEYGYEVPLRIDEILLNHGKIELDATAEPERTEYVLPDIIGNH